MKRLLLTALALLAASCADPVEDIDRTQGNLLRKADIAGEWYYMQTIVAVPPTSAVTLVGETSITERLRWEIQHDVLLGYRTYELVPGSGDTSRDDGDAEVTGYPVVGFAILDHVDITREYNAATGEQSNVIYENTSDRLWHEREWVRVDWSQNLVTNFDFITPSAGVTSVAWFREAEEDGPDPFYSEKNEDGLHYFDVLGRLVVDPGEIDWGDGYPPDPACWYNLLGVIEDCASAEVEVRHSFSKVPTQKRYEPFHYDDQMLSRFGFFRTEFSTYDVQHGVTDAGQRYLLNRHDIWKNSWDGDKPIPIAEREVRTIPYYLNVGFPDDDLLLASARNVMEQWNLAAKRAVAGLKGTGDVADVFILCENPVPEGAHEGCGEVGFSPRVGDLRYSVLHWVDEVQIQGPLGYGPAAIDPVTGEIISGKGYMYAGGINGWATDAVDIIRYYNDELELSALTSGSYFTEELIADLTGRGRKAKASKRLDRKPVSRSMRRPGTPARKRVRREDLRTFDRDAVRRKLQRAREAGAGALRMNDEVRKAVSARAGQRWQDASQSVRERLDPSRVYGPEARWRHQALRKRARSRNVALRDAIAPDLAGIVSTYLGRTDYDEIWRELRAEILGSTAEHEIGHTIGLRHNFQGSYDSLNYPDEYWDLRAENIDGDNAKVGAIYRLANLTEAQSEGQMRQRQYSSIMDYNYNWQSDLGGIGKYDEAAIVFGYSAGSHKATGKRCEDYPSVADGDGCLANLPGLVEVFAKTSGQLEQAGAWLTALDPDVRDEFGDPIYTFDDPGLPSVTLLERRHYVNVANAFPSLDDLRTRELMGYADYLDQKGENDRKVRVPYLFCSDEWEGALISCHAYDQGAEPFELTLSRVRDYRAYYPFVNFRRNRAFFAIDDPYYRYYWYNFLPLSDYFQAWYVAPFGYDDLFDRGYELAVYTAFNALAEVLTTPAYGEYCEDETGGVQWFGDQPQFREEGYSTLCREDGRRLSLARGVGRREFSRYDPGEGYNVEYKPTEAGHYWATWAAVEAMFDPDAYVVGVEGDAGVYAISFYDVFEAELEDLVNGLLTKNYRTFSPTALPADSDDEVVASAIRYRPPAPIFDDDYVLYDPETGEAIGQDAANREQCQPCDFDIECIGGNDYCQPIQDGSYFCLQDCTEEDNCPDGTECDEVGNCVPSDGDCAALAPDCDADHAFGLCEPGEACVDGACRWQPRIEAEPTFSMWSDLLWYGMLYTTSDLSTQFNDRIHVFKPGAQGEGDYDPRASEKYWFTNPLTGVSYAAVQQRCLLAGSTGHCGECEEDSECAGYTEELGGIFCQPIEDGADTWHCLRDCTESEETCGAGETCNEVGNCVPEGLVCEGPFGCGPGSPDGSCAVGTTCVEGGCMPATCRSEGQRDSGGVLLVKRGQQLAEAYATALERSYATGLTPPESERRDIEVGNTQYELTNHVSLLETLISTYSFFGNVY